MLSMEIVKLAFSTIIGAISIAYSVYSLCLDDLDFSNIVIIIILILIDCIVIYTLNCL